MLSGIYQIKNTISGKVYIGSAVRLSKRFNDHKHLLTHSKHHNIKLQRAWLKYGPKAFVFETILVCDPENLLMYEQRCIDGFDSVATGYNLCPVAGSILGTHRADATKEKISAAHKGRVHEGQALENMRAGRCIWTEEMKKAASLAKKGVPLSDAVREKIVAANKGRKPGEDTRKKLSAANTGRTLSQDTKNKISEAKKGVCFSAEHKAKLAAAWAIRRARAQQEAAA